MFLRLKLPRRDIVILTETSHRVNFRTTYPHH